jgi:hypothetical protein
MEVPLVQDQEVVETLSPDRSDEPLGEGILPGCAWGDEHLPDPIRWTRPGAIHRGYPD